MTNDFDRSAPERFSRLVDKTMDLMERILEDMGQSEDPEQPGCRGDTKSLKEFVSGLKELKSMLQEEAAPQETLRVIFEAGEEDFNA